MSRLFGIFVAVLVAAGMQNAGAQHSSTQAERLLASAQHKATIDGDLRGAIAEYKKALAAAGNDRVLAVQTLLRMAECHQKLGEAEAQAIYQRVVRDYADQKDAVILAQARLVAPSSPERLKGDRAVWTGRAADGFGTISPDGRFLTYTEWSAGGHLALRDLVGGKNYRLTAGGSTQFSAISRDGRLVAYEWAYRDAPADTRRYELRVARLHATGISESRRLYQNDDVTAAAPYDWSPDGRWIAVGVGRKDTTKQIGLIGVQDGSLRVLKSTDWKEPTKIFFSPDGRYIAYDLMVSDSSDERHVFVMAVDGSRETAVVPHPSQNVIMGWSPDGQHVLFASDRSGSVGLWAVPVEDGRAGGTATLLKADVASSWSLGLTSSGTMYVWKYASPIYVQASSIDLSSGQLLPGPTTFQRFIRSRGRPAWSADGKHLAYQSCDPLGAGPCTLWIRSMESGQLRELKPKLRYFFFPRWSPDGRELLARGWDMRRRENGLYRIDAQTGDVMLVVAPFTGTLPDWSADGRHVVYRSGSSILERDLASGKEREVVQIPTPDAGPIAMSPDGRHIAYLAGDPSVSQTLFMMPLAGGTSRPLLHVSAPERLLSRFDWTSDGRAIALAKQGDDTGRTELWIVDVSGAKTRKLDIDVGNWLIEDGFGFDRAGKQVAFVAAAGKPGLEIRALENFLPARVASKHGVK